MGRTCVPKLTDHPKPSSSHGNVVDTSSKTSRKRLADVQRVRIDYDDVVSTLEREGVEKFAQSFAQLLDTIGQKRGELAAV